MGYKAGNKTILSFQLTKGEHETLKRAAKHLGRSVSDLIRDAVFEKFIQAAPDPDNDLQKFKMALTVGQRATLEYLEKRADETGQKAAVDAADYGRQIGVTARKIAKKPLKKQA